MTARRLVAVALACAAADPTLGEVTPSPGMQDARIQTVLYDPDQVVALQVAPGFALTVELATDERIENIVVGNSAVWQVTPNRRGDHLFVKPMQGANATNMEVITDARHYSFLLEPAFDGMLRSAFVVRFRYASVPPDVETIVPSPSPARYRLRGDRDLRPASMSDDGERTAIRWLPGAMLPAIYEVDDRGREALVNGRMVDGTYVIEGIAARYVFRIDRRKASAARFVPSERRQ